MAALETPPQKQGSLKTVLDAAATEMLAMAISATAEEDGHANLAKVGAHVAKQAPDFDARNYGFPRLTNLVETSGIAEVDRVGGNPTIVRVRLKAGNTSARKT